MPTKREDAASIVGDDLADELEKRQLESLTERSDGEVDPSAIVVKQEEEEELVERPEHYDEEDEEEEEAEEEMRKKRKKKDKYKSMTLDGAMDLDEAEAALAERSADAAYLDQWDVLGIVLTNIAGEEKADQVLGVMDDFQRQLDVMTARSVIELNEFLQNMVAEESDDPPPEPQTIERSEREVDMPDHPLDEAIAELKSAYDEALETPIDGKSRLHMIQPALQTVGETIQRSIAQSQEPSASPQGGVDMDAIANVVREAVAPLQKRLEDIEGGAAVSRKAPDQPKIPAPRNLGRNQQVPASVNRMAGSDKKPSSIRSLVRKSVGLDS